MFGLDTFGAINFHILKNSTWRDNKLCASQWQQVSNYNYTVSVYKVSQRTRW